MKQQSRQLTRQMTAAKVQAGFAPKMPLPKGTRLPVSHNRQKQNQRLARLHARMACLRRDFLHKLTSRLCRENQALGLEDLHLKGMLANHRLARALSDVGLGEFRRQLEYKAPLYGTRLHFADRWYPSSRLCSVCAWKYEGLSLSERSWTCRQCGIVHDRDLNAALNLQRLATATALLVANCSATDDTESGFPRSGEKVTPARYEHRLQEVSGQEQNRAHLSALS